MKFKKFMLVFSLMLCILFTISYVAAGDVNDTAVSTDSGDAALSSDADDVEISSADENQVIEKTDEDLVSKSNAGTFLELQAQILLASDGATINLDKDYSFDTSSNITTGILINKNLTINGNGHTLDGMSKSRIFTIFYGVKSNNNIVLKNIVFKNGVSKYYGGAILNFANLVVDNCVFTNNHADTVGGAINSLGSLNLKNSKFTSNTAGGDAGAVFSLNIEVSYELYKPLDLEHNENNALNLIFNIAMNFSLKHCKDYISNCIFTNNVAGGTGGGAVYAFSHIDISSSTFNSNKAGQKGGAVFGCKDLFIKNSKFNKNRAGMYGGAVFFKCHEQTGYYEKDGSWVSSVKFYSNLIQNSVFADNVAGERGGAIYGFKPSASDKVHGAKAVKCTFSDNKAPAGKDIYGGTLSKCIYKNTRIVIKTVVVKKSAKRIVLMAALKKGSTPLVGKLVTFKFNGKTYRAKTNRYGIAKVIVNKNLLKRLKVGRKVIYAAGFAGHISKKVAVVRK